jgi:ribosomal protein S18 acetylase RimI-like enzyme
MIEEIRKVTSQDVVGLKEILVSSELFPPEYLDDMIADYFSNPGTEDIWVTYVEDNVAIGFGYCAPEEFTNGTYNLYAIAVRKEFQRKGIGRAIVNFVEELLTELQARVLIVETSGKGQYTPAQQFYVGLGYKNVATIPDFWNAGEDKIVFWKRLSETSAGG